MQSQALQLLIASEKVVLDALIRDTHFRREYFFNHGLVLGPLSVWLDYDHTDAFTEVDKRTLKQWEELSEWMKAHLGFQMGLELGGFSFTANLHPGLESKWLSNGTPIAPLIQKRVRRELEAVGLKDLPYFYVIEGRSRHTKSRTGLHIHGYFVTET